MAQRIVDEHGRLVPWEYKVEDAWRKVLGVDGNAKQLREKAGVSIRAFWQGPA
jgi:hypothetical protein